MGNSAIRYTSSSSEGGGLPLKLAGKTLDFPTFSRIIQGRFSVTSQFLELLWLGFASELPSKVDMSDFIATLGVVLGTERGPQMRFLFRVYDVKQVGYIDKIRLERLLQLVYSDHGDGSANGGKRYGAFARISSTKIKAMLDTLFHAASNNRNLLTLKEFESYVGPMEVLLVWIQTILEIFKEPPSPRLLAIERRFASALEVEEMMSRYRQPRATCDQLRQIFYNKCNASAKAELPFDAWVEWSSVSGYISPELAAVLFRIKIGTYKNVWRFADFAEFCMVFGAGSNKVKARAICAAFVSEFLSMQASLVASSAHDSANNGGASGPGRGAAAFTSNGNGNGTDPENCSDSSAAASAPSTPPRSRPFPFSHSDSVLAAFKRHMRRMLYLLVHAYTPVQGLRNKIFSANAAQSPPRVDEPQRPRSGSQCIDDSLSNNRTARSLSLSLSSSKADLLGAEEAEVVGVSSTATRGGGGGGGGGGGAGPSCPDDYYTSLVELEGSMPPLPQSITMALELIETEGTFIQPVDPGSGGSLPGTPGIPTPPRGDSLLFPPSYGLGAALPGLGVANGQASALPVQPYIDLVASYAANFPALRELSMTACCLFGVRPSTPALEKEYVTGILLRRQEEAPQTRADPYGPVNSDWCVISRQWWEKWRLFVGQQRPKLPVQRTPKKGEKPKPEVELLPPSEPGEIDNWSILRKTGAKQLLQGTLVGHHLEVIPPALYRALHLWYGGGAKITRRVVLGPSGSTELELFPLCLKICTCDNSGKARPVERELLFSKTALIADVALELCVFFGADKNKVRLWNYAMSAWNKQYILDPELSLSSAGIQDGQTILMEVSLPNGAWPRSQLHVALETEEEKKKSHLAAASGGDGAAGGAASSTAAGGPTGATVESGGKGPEDRHDKQTSKQVRNTGTVGLENQGNTCYLNSSLQVLLHTQPLVDYFLSGSHLKHINHTNRLGLQGRLASAFGKLASELWTTDKKALTPKTFYSVVTAAHSDFAGHQQQDAYDFLNVFLEKLSEDLNLVDDKPYIEHPDSNDRPDAELADIWWCNHFKREVSIVQALFTGQFKSTTRCDCGYTSARFETFTSLNLPIPEETHRTLIVHVFPRGISWGIQCSVTVRRDGLLADVVAAFMSSDFQPPLPGLGDDHNEQPQPLFLAAEVNSSRVIALSSLSRRLVSVKDTDNLFFFQTLCQPTMASARRTVMFLSPGNINSSGSDDNDEDAEEDAKTSTPDPPATAAATTATAALVAAEDDSDGVQSISRPPPEPMCRIVLLQRKVRFHEHAGVEYFKMEPFGLPLMEVWHRAKLTGRQVYELVYQRVLGFLLQDIKSKTAGEAAGPPRRAFPDIVVPSDSATSVASATTAKSVAAAAAAADDSEMWGSDTDSLLGGAVSPFGFALRRVVGGAHGGCNCSVCPWLARCEGCLVPCSDESAAAQVVSFRDGETLAIDWHRIVWEELLDTVKAVCVKRHDSVSHASGTRGSSVPSTPLSSVLEKFTEEEKLGDIVCPKCKSDEHLYRRFELWRCPPILVMTLKRFQFDRTVRRKLNNKIDFPISGLDLASYLASSRAAAESGASPSSPRDGPPLYDLYGTVHHVGMLGGGHYIAACCNSDAPAHSGDDKAAATGAHPWHIFNDGLVTKLQDVNEAAAASAYLLFFRRRDCSTASHAQLFPEGLAVDRLRNKPAAAAAEEESAAENGHANAGSQPGPGGIKERVKQLAPTTRRVKVFAADAPPAQIDPNQDPAEVTSGGRDCNLQ